VSNTIADAIPVVAFTPSPAHSTTHDITDSEADSETDQWADIRTH
jgi:hypothetical protein